MTNDCYYLRPNVQVEPLIDHWFAWPHLIPPATWARNVTERHMKIMESYISAPDLHAAAVKNPQLSGGPFIDCPGERVDEIRCLYDRIVRCQTGVLELSSAIEQLDEMLRSQARGFCLHAMYEKIPGPLRGFVELVYDRNNNPSFRLFEALLYKSKHYASSLQSLMLSPILGDNRPFILSTPRLPDERSLHLQVPFSDERVDQLFRMKSVPCPSAKIRDLLAGQNYTEPLLDTLFTTGPPSPYEPYQGTGVRWRYFGHACILVETRGISILVDPVLSYTYETDISRYTYGDLPETIDYVLITHNHQDHILFETMLQLRHKVKTIVIPKGGTGSLQDPSLKLILRSIGFQNEIIELSELEQITLAGGYIQGVPFLGEHGDLDIPTKLGYYVRVGRNRLMFVADSCNIDPTIYERVHHVTGDVDVLFVGMECQGAPLSWLYGPLLTQRVERRMDESRRLNGSDFEQARRLAEEFGAREVYVYAMGQEPWITHISSIRYTDESRPIVESEKLLKHCASMSICAERLFGEKEILLSA
jgi:L-ascorbate metabolism protein UlaG (beta-lactamase superfamily)